MAVISSVSGECLMINCTWHDKKFLGIKLLFKMLTWGTSTVSSWTLLMNTVWLLCLMDFQFSAAVSQWNSRGPKYTDTNQNHRYQRKVHHSIVVSILNSSTTVCTNIVQFTACSVLNLCIKSFIKKKQTSQYKINPWGCHGHLYKRRCCSISNVTLERQKFIFMEVHR